MRLECSICPRLGVNITPLEIKAIPSILRHVFRLHLTNDGNFQLNRYRKGKHSRTTDVGLWGGNGYSPDPEELECYLRGVNDKVEVSVCSRYRRNDTRIFIYL